MLAQADSSIEIQTEAMPMVKIETARVDNRMRVIEGSPFD